jgi:hypothetical protein
MASLLPSTIQFLISALGTSQNAFNLIDFIEGQVTPPAGPTGSIQYNNGIGGFAGYAGGAWVLLG